jgi:hypothetical protein
MNGGVPKRRVRVRFATVRTVDPVLEQFDAGNPRTQFFRSFDGGRADQRSQRCAGASASRRIRRPVPLHAFPIWHLDQHGVWTGLAAQHPSGWHGLSPLFLGWPLGEHRLWLVVGDGLGLGLGSLPLWPLVLAARLRLGMAPRHHLGTGLGGLAIRGRLRGLGSARPVRLRLGEYLSTLVLLRFRKHAGSECPRIRTSPRSHWCRHVRRDASPDHGGEGRCHIHCRPTLDARLGGGRAADRDHLY